ncbi:MAG: hypothetical protein NTV89_18230 [Proteobacteria bacterium]|nr:hypothetical protein [Pseudomonadota bacterium]
MQLNAYGINKVYTLINTGGGQPGGPYAWLEFWGSQGAYFRKDLFGNVDMRDWNLDGWTNYINNTTTVNVFLVNPGIYNGETRLDMQQIDLPEEFLTQSLTEIRLTDIGGSNFQRAFIVGATVCNAEITLVKLASFTAAPKSGKVLIQWATESEIDNAGFNLYRAETENGEYKKINTALIPAKGSSTQGASYEFVDSNVKNRKTYFYKLEDIDTSGVSTLHGPVKATPRLIFRLRD